MADLGEKAACAPGGRVKRRSALSAFYCFTLTWCLHLNVFFAAVVESKAENHLDDFLLLLSIIICKTGS